MAAQQNPALFQLQKAENLRLRTLLTPCWRERESKMLWRLCLFYDLCE